MNDFEKIIIETDSRAKSNQKRIDKIEAKTDAIERLAISLENMVKELEKQGKRIEVLEKAPIAEFDYYKRTIAGCIITGIVGAILGAVLALIF